MKKGGRSSADIHSFIHFLVVYVHALFSTFFFFFQIKVARKLVILETDLERAEERAEVAEL